MSKIALVTGAGTGIGRGIAISLAKEGYRVILTGRREEKLREVEKEINEEHTVVIPSDVTKELEVQNLRKKLLQETGDQLDLLVNNVGGLSSMKPIGETSLQEWNKLMDLNLTSQFLVTKAFLPDLRKSKQGKIISITSMMAHYFMKGYGAYSASKAGVEALMKTIAEEEKEHGLQVHLFDPGNVRTEGNPHGESDPMEIAKKVMDLLK